jgi:hypothetical protein
MKVEKYYESFSQYFNEFDVSFAGHGKGIG